MSCATPTVIGMADYPIELVRSTRRKKTASAGLVDGRIQVRVPAQMSETEANRVAAELSAKVKRKLDSGSVDLAQRAAHLARRYDLPTPKEIKWSSRQNTRWGSCTASTGVIRISDRLTSVPPWVVDAVIVHELAHLAVDGHDERFWALANRYELMERARGYLEAVSHLSQRSGFD